MNVCCIEVKTFSIVAKSDLNEFFDLDILRTTLKTYRMKVFMKYCYYILMEILLCSEEPMFYFVFCIQKRVLKVLKPILLLDTLWYFLLLWFLCVMVLFGKFLKVSLESGRFYINLDITQLLSCTYFIVLPTIKSVF